MKRGKSKKRGKSNYEREGERKKERLFI